MNWIIQKWKGINCKQSTRWQHLSRLKASAFFSLQIFLVVMKHSNLYLGLVLPSGGWQSLIWPPWLPRNFSYLWEQNFLNDTESIPGILFMSGSGMSEIGFLTNPVTLKWTERDFQTIQLLFKSHSILLKKSRLWKKWMIWAERTSSEQKLTIHLIQSMFSHPILLISTTLKPVLLKHYRFLIFGFCSYASVYVQARESDWNTEKTQAFCEIRPISCKLRICNCDIVQAPGIEYWKSCVNQTLCRPNVCWPNDSVSAGKTKHHVDQMFVIQMTRSWLF